MTTEQPARYRMSALYVSAVAGSCNCNPLAEYVSGLINRCVVRSSRCRFGQLKKLNGP